MVCQSHRYPLALGSRGLSFRVRALLAQSAERFHGKEKVVGSIPTEGSATLAVVSEFTHD